MKSYEKFNKLIDLIGKDNVVTEILNYFSSNDIDEFVDSVANDHDIVIDEETYIENILNTVEQWFIDYTGEDFYFDHKTRMKDLNVMANGSNDIMVDNCVEYLTDMYSRAEDYKDEIKEKLIELASDEI